MNDSEIIKLIRSGDNEAFLQLMSQYKKLLWVIAGGILNKAGTSRDVEECISDVFVELWKNAGSFDPGKGTLKAYLSVIAKNKAIDKYRQLTKADIVEYEDTMIATEEDELLNYIAKQELYDELYSAMQTLP